MHLPSPTTRTRAGLCRYSPQAIAAKVKHFFTYYAINRHKATVRGAAAAGPPCACTQQPRGLRALCPSTVWQLVRRLACWLGVLVARAFALAPPDVRHSPPCRSSPPPTTLRATRLMTTASTTASSCTTPGGPGSSGRSTSWWHARLRRGSSSGARAWAVFWRGCVDAVLSTLRCASVERAQAGAPRLVRLAHASV